MPDATGPTQWQLFTAFTAAYPRQQHLRAAWAAWQQIHPRPDRALVERMLQTLAWQRRDPQWANPTYVPYARSWLRDRRWEDEPFEPPSAMPVRPPRPQTKRQAITAANQETLRRFLARGRRGETS
jgi:hypothetical protein